MKKFYIFIQVLIRNKDYLNIDVIRGTGKKIPKEGELSVHNIEEREIIGETWETAREKRTLLTADGLVKKEIESYENNWMIIRKQVSGGILHSIKLVFVLDSERNEVYRNKDLLHPDFFSFCNKHIYKFDIKE